MNRKHVLQGYKPFMCLLMAILVQLAIMTVTAATTSFDETWKQVNEMVKADRPESALELVAAIEKQAIAEKNCVQRIKARVMMMKWIVNKDPDQLSAQLSGMETLTNEISDEPAKALLKSIVAESYLNYYKGNAYAISRRTPIKGQVPTNLSEWTANLFADTIRALLAQSLQPAERLQTTGVEAVMKLLTKHDAVIEPSVYDVLARRRIMLLINLREVQQDRDLIMVLNPLFDSAERFVNQRFKEKNVSDVENDILGAFQQWLQFRLRDGNRKAYIHTDVYRLQTLYTIAYPERNSDAKPTPPTTAQQLYLRTLQELTTRNAANELMLKTVAAQAQYYLAFYNDQDPIYKNYKYKAYQLVLKGLNRFPQSIYNSELRSLQFQLTNPGVNLTNKSVVKRNTPLEVRVRANNASQAELTVYRVNLTPREFLNQRNNLNDTIAASACTVLERRTVQFNADTLLNPVDTTLVIKGLDYGQYGYSLRIPGNRGRLANAFFVVSDMASMSKMDGTEICVVDRMTGKPYPNVTVNVFKTRGGGKGVNTSEPPLASGKTDREGFFTYTSTDNSGNIVFCYERGADCHLITSFNSYRYYGAPNSPDYRELTLLTDRAIYRPGQTVHVKGIAYEASKDIQRVLPNERYEVELVDANNQSVSKQSFTTNDFGSFSGTFVLPATGLSGRYTLRCGTSHSVSFRVEEYKRPTFTLELKKPETTVAFGKTVTVTGNVKSYAGYPVNGATVTYQVSRRADYQFVSSPTRETVISGETQTQADGTFTVSFPAERLSMGDDIQLVNYEISTTVTDQKGETREARCSVSVGDQSLIIYTNINGTLVIDKTVGRTFNVQVHTINGKEIPAEVDYELYLLDPSTNYIDAGDDKGYTVVRQNERIARKQRKPGKLVRSGRFNTKESPLKLDFNTLASGQYQLVCTTTDSNGRKEQDMGEFSLYAPKDKHIPVKAYAWLNQTYTKIAPDKPAFIQFGTAAKDVYVLYRVMKNETCLERAWIRMSNELKTFTIPYEERYGDGVDVQFTFVKDEQFFTHSVMIVHSVEYKNILKPVLSVFRDELHPGESAKWTISIPELKALNKPAEVLADMYDASLDAISSHYLGFYPGVQLNTSDSRSWVMQTPRKESVNQLGRSSYRIYPATNLSNLDFAWMDRFLQSEVTLQSVIPLREISMAAQSIDGSLQGQIAGLDIVSSSGDPGIPIAGSDKPKPQITPRRFFNETAFFYPHLLTDTAGNVTFSFTVPESLTRWMVFLVAHTQDLYYGAYRTQVETRKDLMVQLNMPRFVRQADKPVLSATVVNLSNKPLTTAVALELLNPEDEKPIAGSISGQASQTLTLAPNETRVVSWNLNTLTSTDLVICKVVASAGTFSDGEQHYLAVLPDKQLVTETQPLTVTVNQTKQYTLEQVLKPAQGVTPHALTVEFSPNPSWTAVQALPGLANPTNDNALDYFTAYYVNTLAGHIVHSYPKLAAVFEQWGKTGNSSGLLSTLSKNQQLKTLLLEETPWVVAAKDETEQRRQLSLLFDLNQQKNRQADSWSKLLKLQQPDGGFAWFIGMPTNRYVTYYILLNQARLNALVNPTAKPDNALLKALAYADKTIADDYEQLKRQPDVQLDKMHISDMQWFYLHLRSQYPDVKLFNASKEAVAYYTKQAETYWTQGTLYGKAATALIAARNGNATLATAILTALKEQSLTKEDMGMYWAANKAGWGWSERPVMVQTMLLETFAEVAPKTAPLDAMKTWLLRQKQTQRWDSPLSTVDAVFALLHYGQDWFGSTNEVSLKLGDVTVPTASKEAGTGYIQHTYEARDIQPSMGKVSVSLKGTSGMGWGAIYWQYYQNIDQVRAQGGNGLTVSKQLFVEQKSATGTVMVPASSQALKTGDKVITRLLVTVDRDMDFVVLKDQRAACFEPAKQLSSYVWAEGTGYYQTSKDASTQFFFNNLRKGSYAFEYAVYVNNAGTFTDGVATLQCLYAPEFTAHSNGGRIEVKPAGK